MHVLKLAKFPLKVMLIAGVILFKWHLVQLIAWLFMSFRYSLEYGLKRGIKMTFSGDYPCPICLLKADGSAQELAFWQFTLSHPMVPLLAVVALIIFFPSPKLAPSV